MTLPLKKMTQHPESFTCTCLVSFGLGGSVKNRLGATYPKPTDEDDDHLQCVFQYANLTSGPTHCLCRTDIIRRLLYTHFSSILTKLFCIHIFHCVGNRWLLFYWSSSCDQPILIFHFLSSYEIIKYYPINHLFEPSVTPSRKPKTI